MSETATGPEIRCEAGQPVKPTRFDCRRHPKHWWCRTCAGWYGVPHKGLHPHPHDRQCACRVCEDWFWEPAQAMTSGWGVMARKGSGDD